jgi:hypothetical protein
MAESIIHSAHPQWPNRELHITRVSGARLELHAKDYQACVFFWNFGHIQGGSNKYIQVLTSDSYFWTSLICVFGANMGLRFWRQSVACSYA